RDRSREQIPHGMVPVSAHDQKAGLKISNLLQQRLGRSQDRFDHVELMWCAMNLQKLRRQIGHSFRIPATTLNHDDLSCFATGQTQQLKCLERPSHLPSSTISDNHTISLRKFTRHNNCRPRTASENKPKSLVRLILSFEMEIRFAAQKNQIATMRVLQN